MTLTTTALLLAALSSTDAETSPPPAPPVVTATPETPATAPTVKTFGIYTAANLGLFGVDYQNDHFYGFAAGNAGIPMITNGSVGGFALGAGWTAPLSKGRSPWQFDAFAMTTPGWLGGTAHVGVGVGVGLRFLHASGFTLGFKLPVFGLAIGPSNSAASLGTFFLASAIALPVVSVGWRF